MAQRIIVKLNKRIAGHVYTGRPPTRKKRGIASVNQFNEKMVFLQKIAKRGCPFAQLALTSVDVRTTGVIEQMIRHIRTLENKIGDRSIERDIKFTEDIIEIDVSHYQEASLRVMHALVVYDELNSELHKYLIRTNKITGGGIFKISTKYRAKIRGAMSFALQYTDYGFRSSLSDDDKNKIGYNALVKIYGEPLIQTSKVIAIS